MSKTSQSTLRFAIIVFGTMAVSAIIICGLCIVYMGIESAWPIVNDILRASALCTCFVVVFLICRIVLGRFTQN